MISWSYLFEASFCWALFFGYYTLWLKKETHFRFNRWYLLVTLIAGAILPLFQFSMPGAGESSGIVQQFYAEVIVGVRAIESSITEQGNTFSILKAFYLTGIFTSIMVLLTGFFRILLYLKSSVIKQMGDHLLVRTEIDHAPFSFLNLLFLSTKSTLIPEEEDQIILHELTHIREKHSIDVLLTEVFRILFWFHPIVYLYQRSIRNTHEFLADAAVLETTPKARYGRLLLEQSFSGPHLVNHFNKSQLKKRLIMMTRIKSSRLALTKYFLAIPIFALCLFLFSFSNADYPIFPDATKTIEKSTYGEVDEMPRFPGCEEREGTVKEKETCAMNKMITFIGSNLKYPEDARKKGVEGMVVVSFVVAEDGAIKKTSITKSLNDACDKEAMRVVAAMPNWIPGNKDGRPLPVEMKLPFKFKL